MENNCNFIIIHGIGNAQEGYSKKIENHIRKYLKSSSNVKFYEYLWADKIKEGEEELLSNIDNLKLSDKKSREWFIVHISDVISYLRDEEISKEIKEDFRNILNQLLTNPDKINIIIAHSLGSVIAYDVLKGYYEHGLRTDYFFTLGSPLAMFVNDFQKEKTYFSPIHTEKGWLNILSPHDIIGFPLQDIDEQWNKNIVQDKIVDFGNILKRFSPIIHSEYFNNKKIAKIIVEYINKNEKKEVQNEQIE